MFNLISIMFLCVFGSRYVLCLTNTDLTISAKSSFALAEISTCCVHTVRMRAATLRQAFCAFINICTNTHILSILWVYM